MEKEHYEEDNILLRELFLDVKLMRTAQKDYFFTRSDAALHKAKAAEKEVDKRIQGIDYPSYDAFGKRLPYAN